MNLSSGRKGHPDTLATHLQLWQKTKKISKKNQDLSLTLLPKMLLQILEKNQLTVASNATEEPKISLPIRKSVLCSWLGTWTIRFTREVGPLHEIQIEFEKFIWVSCTKWLSCQITSMKVSTLFWQLRPPPQNCDCDREWRLRPWNWSYLPFTVISHHWRTT